MLLFWNALADVIYSAKFSFWVTTQRENVSEV